MTAELGRVKSVKLSPDEKSNLEWLMASANSVLRKAAIRNYRQPDVRRLRDEFLQGKKLKLGKMEKATIRTVLDAHTKTLEGYGGAVVAVCKKFHLRRFPALSIDDLFQVGCLALYDAMFMFNGKTRFTTFLYRVVRNRLLDLVKAESTSMRVGEELEQLREEIDGLMDQHHIGFDQAIEMIQEYRELRPAQIERCRRTYITVTNAGGDVGYTTEEPEDYLAWEKEHLADAIQKAAMTPQQREIISVFLQEGRGTLAIMAKRWGCSREWARQVFDQACLAIRVAFGRGAKAA